jgi:ABC-type uncharacterized transport system permease subunit
MRTMPANLEQRPLPRRAARPGAWRRAVDVTLRTLSAVLLGYFVAHAFAGLMAAVLPFARPDRVVAGSMLSFLAWAGVGVYAFAARSPWRAVLVPAMLGASMLGGAMLFAEQAVRP